MFSGKYKVITEFARSLLLKAGTSITKIQSVKVITEFARSLLLKAGTSITKIQSVKKKILQNFLEDFLR